MKSGSESRAALNENPLGIYEKAFPGDLSLPERLRGAKELGFDFLELSVDESDERLRRLRWPSQVRSALRKEIEDAGIRVPSMCFSGHRRFPMGSHDAEVRQKAVEMMQEAINLASDLGIRVIQLAGYDVYYETADPETHASFVLNLHKAAEMAARAQVMLAIEIMDTSYINSITKYLWYDKTINSPWLAVYPDVGNLTAWNCDVEEELRIGLHRIVGLHLKETLKVTDEFPGQFRDVPFGSGNVDFIKLFQTLSRIGYAGPLLIEMWSASAAWKAEITAARDFILEKMQQAKACV